MGSSKKRAAKLLALAVMAGACWLGYFAKASAHAGRSPRQIGAPSNAVEPEQSSTGAAVQEPAQSKPWGMSAEEAQRRSAGCVDCHNGIEDMHSGKINLGCVDCHGGNAQIRAPQG